MSIPNCEIEKRIRIDLDGGESYAYVRDAENDTVTLTADLSRFEDRERAAEILMLACDDLADQLYCER
jgi:hypothetical protein